MHDKAAVIIKYDNALVLFLNVNLNMSLTSWFHLSPEPELDLISPLQPPAGVWKRRPQLCIEKKRTVN